jgi:hypothetical protein
MTWPVEFPVREEAMLAMNRACRASALLGFALAAMLSLASLGAGRDDVVVDPPIGDPEIGGPSSTEPGMWRTRTQQVLDPAERTLVRRMYVVWDPAPARNLDFAWIADSLAADREGRVNGEGRLIWRFKGKPAYDPASVFGEFHGSMKDGRPDGHGRYFDRTGITAEGEWKNGLLDGPGRLTLPGGDEYAGQMRAGKANGSGRYVDVTGEIFEGRFVDGLREGPGTTTLPDGSSYRSQWVAGKETEDSQRVRIAQSTGQRLPGGADDVRLGITVDRTGARDGDLKYAASSTGARLSIRPDNKRLMDMWKGGGEIQLTDQEEGGDEHGVLSLSRGQLFPLTLVLEVQNRSSAPIQVAGAYLAVETSVTDLQPAIQLDRGENRCGGAEYRPTFKLENFGWGAAERAALRFAFANPSAKTRMVALDLSKSLGRIDTVVEVSLEPELRAAGVNTNMLREKAQSGLACAAKAPAACLQELRASGIFGALAPHVALRDIDIFVSAGGTLNYGWEDSKGAPRSSASPFNMKLPLGHIKIEAECGEGGQRDPIASNPLELRLDQSGYRLPVAFQRGIPAGRTSRLTLQLKAAKSSEHDFNVVLQLADGREITSRPISLLYYVPKWFPNS